MRIALTLDRDASGREENDYLRALLSAGLRRQEILALPPGSPVGEGFDGVVLGGGCDVDPARYGRKALPNAGVEIDPDRDQTDFALFECARRARTPTLAICRGLQVVNVALGGTLIQDLRIERPSPLEHQTGEKEKRRRGHSVRVVPGTLLAAIAGAPEIPVNSRHHQAIDEPAPSLTVAAVAPDGVIEAVETEEPWLLAVQWHPENLTDDAVSRRLFAEFARAARSRAAAGSG